MSASTTVRYFDQQFQRQLHDATLQLNPFEQNALPGLRGQVLDWGCGLGNLAIAAARQGCTVLALDGSPTAIAHLQQRARAEGLAIDARQADLADYQLAQDFDTVVSIGLLMFLDCKHALRQLAQLQARLRPGGLLILNLLVQGTTFLDMFDPQQHCLLPAQQWLDRFEGWQIERCETQDFPAPEQRLKAFLTLVARKPGV